MTTRNGPIMGAFVALVLAFVAAPLFCAIRDTGTRRLVVVLDLTNLDLERGSGYLDDQREALGEEVAEQKRAMSLEGEVEVSTVVVDANGSDESPGRLAPLKTTSWAKARDAVLEAFDERVDYLKSIVDGDSKLVLTDTVAATVSILPGLTEDAKAVRLIYVTDGVSNGREDTPEMLNWNDRKSSTLEDVRSEAQRQAGRLSACESVRVSFIGTGSPVAGRENPGKPVTGIKPEVYTNAKLFWQSVFEGCGGELLSWQ